MQFSIFCFLQFPVFCPAYCPRMVIFSIFPSFSVTELSDPDKCKCNWERCNEAPICLPMPLRTGQKEFCPKHTSLISELAKRIWTVIGYCPKENCPNPIQIGRHLCRHHLFTEAPVEEDQRTQLEIEGQVLDRLFDDDTQEFLRIMLNFSRSHCLLMTRKR